MINDVSRFWSHVDKNGGPDRLKWETGEPWHGDGSSCWMWPGDLTSSDGYGRFGKRLAHRVAWELNNSAPPPKLCVLHWCDHPACVNPDHLYLGTMVDVVLKRDARGHNGYLTHPERTARGSRIRQSNFTDEDVREIRRLRQAGMLQHELVKKFNASRSCISNICNGTTWKHVKCE
jgi:hypothetical protein